MSAVIKNNIHKVKNELNPYLHNNRISLFLDLVEQKIHLERSLIALGILPILAIYLIIGWAIQSPGKYDDRHLLIYWIVYSLLGCIEYFGYSLFNSLFFYWLAKCIFLVWFMKSGSRMIIRRFIQNTAVLNDVQDEHIIETDYHAPPIADFGYSGGEMTEEYRDKFESWEATDDGEYSMKVMFADGGLPTDYELNNINSVTMTPNGKYVIIGQSQGPSQIWDTINGQLVSSMQGITIHSSKVTLACDGTLLVGLASDSFDSQSNILQIWDFNTGKSIELPYQIKCTTFTLSNNSNCLIMAGNQKYGHGISVGIFDLNNLELMKEIKSDTNQSYDSTPSFITLTPDECYAIVGCPSGLTTNYVVFHLITQQELIQPPIITIDSDPQCSIVLNNEQMLTGTINGQIILWNIPSCQRIQTLNDNRQNAHRDKIKDLKFSPDCSCFVTISVDGTAKVWDTNSKEVISKLIGHEREITCACISTNQLVVTGSKDQNICLWYLQSGQIASTIHVGMTPLHIYMAAHNQTIVAIGEKDGQRQLLMLRVVFEQR
ncbi:unnamed protein product [Rotaria sordida]|uniref:Target of rapamycin complex subunit lst8 n=1 Tax=Rotaria sordida TaxID=392033 RepID=A0A814T8K6_9BILA|nr:unnamed protein product [Rotaria sordida]CAF1403221.1 unnamed protein product [Rotaria sordida]